MIQKESRDIENRKKFQRIWKDFYRVIQNKLRDQSGSEIKLIVNFCKGLLKKMDILHIGDSIY